MLIDGTDRELSVKRYMEIMRVNMEAWATDLERTKKGMRCKYNVVENDIKRIKEIFGEDESGKLSNTTTVMFNTQRYQSLIKVELPYMVADLVRLSTKKFTDITSYDRAVKAVKDSIEAFTDELDSIRADKVELRNTFLLDEFLIVVDITKGLISLSKAKKKTNVFGILDTVEDNLIDLCDRMNDLDRNDPEEDIQFAILQQQIQDTKHYLRDVIGSIKEAAGYTYGRAVTFTNKNDPRFNKK